MITFYIEGEDGYDVDCYDIKYDFVQINNTDFMKMALSFYVDNDAARDIVSMLNDNVNNQIDIEMLETRIYISGYLSSFETSIAPLVSNTPFTFPILSYSIVDSSFMIPGPVDRDVVVNIILAFRFEDMRRITL